MEKRTIKRIDHNAEGIGCDRLNDSTAQRQPIFIQATAPPPCLCGFSFGCFDGFSDPSLCLILILLLNSANYSIKQLAIFMPVASKQLAIFMPVVSL